MELTDALQLDSSMACVEEGLDTTAPRPDSGSAFSLVKAYYPEDAQYAHNKLTFVGTRISHLPSALFELLHELMRRYGNSSRCVLAPKDFFYHKEGHSWYAWENDSCGYFAPDRVVLEISVFPDSRQKDIQYLSVEMSTVCFRTITTPTAATTSITKTQETPKTPGQEEPFPASAGEEVAAEGFRQLRKWLLAARTAPRRSYYQEAFHSGVPGGILQAALVLRINGTLKSRYYFTTKRFMNANRGKYCLPGMNMPAGRTWRVCVFDTEMERPYPIQFAGVLLEKTGGVWSVLDRFSTYIRMPEGVRLSRDVARVTRITDERLRREGISEREADEKIQAFLAKADLLCGHAVLADKEIMRTSFMRQQLRLPYSLRRHEMMDTQLILERLFGLDNAVKLEYAAELAGVRREEDVFHDARTDAEVTARLLAALEPDFVKKYQTEPVVCDAMMHAPQQTQLLSRLLG